MVGISSWVLRPQTWEQSWVPLLPSPPLAVWFALDPEPGQPSHNSCPARGLASHWLASQASLGEFWSLAPPCSQRELLTINQVTPLPYFQPSRGFPKIKSPLPVPLAASPITLPVAHYVLATFALAAPSAWKPLPWIFPKAPFLRSGLNQRGLP